MADVSEEAKAKAANIVWSDQEIFDAVHGGEDEDLVEDVDMQNCKISDIEQKHGMFVIKLTSHITGKSYVLIDKTLEKAEEWRTKLHANAEFLPTLLLLDQEKVESAADVVAAESYLDKCTKSRDKLVKTQAFLGSALMRNTLGKAKKLAMASTDRVLTKLQLSKGKNKEGDDELEVIKNKSNYFYKEQANREKLQELIAVAEETCTAAESQYRDIVREIAVCHADCKGIGWLFQCHAIGGHEKHKKDADGYEIKEKKKDIKTTIAKVWVEAEDGQIVIRERHSDTALQEKFEELDVDSLQAIDKFQTQEMLRNVKHPLEGLELQKAFAQMLEIDAEQKEDARLKARADRQNKKAARLAGLKTSSTGKKRKKKIKQKGPEWDARRAFKKADTDGSGFLDHDEMRVLCNKLGIAEEEQLDDAIREMDENLDGDISLDEFLDWWRENIKSNVTAGECSTSAWQRTRAWQRTTGHAHVPIK